jgi:tetratricopeptide (TPR) repeat protein
LRDLDAAERTARELMALEPKGVRGPYALALVLDDRHDSRGVIAALEPVVRQHQSGEPAARSQISPLLVRLGYAYQELGQMDKAVATFERARTVAADPSALDPFVAQAYIAAGQYERALALLQKGRKEEPDDPRLLRLEADALQRSGRTDEAITLLSDHEAKFADDVEVQLAYGSLLAEGGRIDRATRLFDDLDRRFPGRAEIAFQRGAAMEHAKRYAEAEAAFRQALERDPLHAPTLNYFGYMLAERGERLDEAVELVERALKVDPANPSYLDSLGWAYYRKGEYGRAKEYLTRAADRLPRNSVVQDHLGDVLSKLGDRPAAVAAWERALAGDGESIDAGTIRKKISEGRRAPE